MKEKVGRNEPCPCGSGKKYKRCCGREQKFDFSLPDDCKTGSILDEYMILFQGLALFGQGIRQFDADGKELNDTIRDFEKRFRPGEPDGVTDSLFMSWLYIDLRFGKTQKTVIERFLESPYVTKLNDPGPRLLENLASSYFTFYEVQSVSECQIFFNEIGTGRTWNIHRINEPFEREAIAGDVWYVRFVGSPEDGYIYASPYIVPFEEAQRMRLRAAMETQKTEFAKFGRKESAGESLSEDRVFRESCKASVRFWARWLCGNPIDEGDSTPTPTLPEMQNTDGEPLMFSKLYFRIKKADGLRERLSRVRNFDYDDEDDTWMWFKKGNKKLSVFPTTSLASLKLEGGYLVAETNSVERALRLRDKLMKAAGAYVSFERMDTKDTASMLAEFREKKKDEVRGVRKMREGEKTGADGAEQVDINSLPEVREKLRQLAEEYYNKDWLRHRIPALGNRTPFQAVKTPEWRRKLEALLNDIERSQGTDPDNAFRVDVNGLRKKLGLV